MSAYVLAFLIGIVAGLRSMTAPAVVSWSARMGWLRLGDTWLSFLGAAITPYIFTIAAIGELVNDKLPKTPSRKAAGPFAARIVMGALCGAAFGAATGETIGCLIAGIVGAVAGTMGGYTARVHAAKAAGKDLPVALIEDAVAILGAIWICGWVA